jgi:hypothetical protein
LNAWISILIKNKQRVEGRKEGRRERKKRYFLKE